MAVNLTGDQGKFTWSGSPTITDGTTVDIDFWEMAVDRQKSVVRPFGWVLPKVTLGPLRGSGRFRASVVSGQTPPLPAASGATNGTLTLGLQGTTRQYAGTAQITSIRISANSTEASIEQAIYEFEFAGDDSADTITPT